MSKFKNMVSASNSTTLASRASDLEDEVLIEVNAFITNLKREKAQLKSKINKLTDLAPENTTSLRPGHPDFKAEKWVAELHQCRMDLALKEIELKEAEAIFKEYFEEEGEETKK
jgi:polysaccharide deacetylase 2 family uncharacterized protein YibQ